MKLEEIDDPTTFGFYLQVGKTIKKTFKYK
jgi:hypothetical protein